MKIKLLALVAILSVVSAAAQQKYLLPIGSNVNNRPAKVGMAIGDVDEHDVTGWGIGDNFDYTTAMGDLETVVRSRFQELAKRFNPPVGLERDQFCGNIIIDPGPNRISRFYLQNGVIPPEVLEVKLNYGVGTGWKLLGITAVSLNLYKNGNLVKLWTTKDKNSGDSACDIGSAQSVLALGYATINAEYAFPWLKENWWDTGEVTIEAYDGWATFFNANGSPRDGELIAVSSPPPAFLSSLRAPEMQSAQSQAPVFAASMPRIAKITRILANATEIVVEGEAGGTIAVEFSEKLGGEWTAISTPLVLTSVGRRIFTHTTEAPSCFYRLRSADSSSPQ